MKIDRLIAELRRVRREHGNIEVTCTGTTLGDGFNAGAISIIRATGLQPKNLPADVFETTVENIFVTENHPRHGKAARLWM